MGRPIATAFASLPPSSSSASSCAKAPAPVRERAGLERPKKIVVADVPLADYLRTIAPGVEIVGVQGLRNYAGMAEVVAGADVLIGLCTPEIVARGTSLKWIQLLNAGADSCATIPAVAERGILVTNLQRIQGPHMAEHAIALLLSLARALPSTPSSRTTAPSRAVFARRAASGRSRSRQDAARRRLGRHRHGGREARARARHARDRDAQQPSRRPGLRRVRRARRRIPHARGARRRRRERDAADAGDARHVRRGSSSPR